VNLEQLAADVARARRGRHHANLMCDEARRELSERQRMAEDAARRLAEAERRLNNAIDLLPLEFSIGGVVLE
jgi:hypothetical protein